MNCTYTFETMKLNKPTIFLIGVIALFTTVYFLNKPNSKPLVFEEFEFGNIDDKDIGVLSKWILVSNYEDTADKRKSIDSLVCTMVDKDSDQPDTVIKQKQFLFFKKTENTTPANLEGLASNAKESKVDEEVIVKYDFYSSGTVHVWLFNNGKPWTVLHDFSCD